MLHDHRHIRKRLANGMSSCLRGLVGKPTNDGDWWNLEDWRFSP